MAVALHRVGMYAIPLLNLLFVGFGFFGWVYLFPDVRVRMPRMENTAPYAAQFYWALTAIYSTLLLALAVTSIRMIRGSEKGMRQCRTVFFMELVVWVLVLFASTGPHLDGQAERVRRSISYGEGSCGVLIWAQIFSGYAVLAPIAITLLLRRRSPRGLAMPPD
jgi:hypothetical protein